MDGWLIWGKLGGFSTKVPRLTGGARFDSYWAGLGLTCTGFIGSHRILIRQPGSDRAARRWWNAGARWCRHGPRQGLAGVHQAGCSGARKIVRLGGKERGRLGETSYGIVGSGRAPMTTGDEEARQRKIGEVKEGLTWAETRKEEVEKDVVLTTQI